MKEMYTKPVLEIEQFKTDDVITTSIDQIPGVDDKSKRWQGETTATVFL